MMSLPSRWHRAHCTPAVPRSPRPSRRASARSTFSSTATCSRSPGPTCPGSTARGRDSPGRRPARGRPGVGTHSGSALPRYDIHYESPGVPDPPPSPGFRDCHIKGRLVQICVGSDATDDPLQALTAPTNRRAPHKGRPDHRRRIHDAMLGIAPHTPPPVSRSMPPTFTRSTVCPTIAKPARRSLFAELAAVQPESIYNQHCIAEPAVVAQTPFTNGAPCPRR